MFSLCVLLYGDYLPLAERVLTSIVASQPRHVHDLRIGLNEVGEATRSFVWNFAGTQMLNTPVYLYEPPRNVGKYPLMRRMFYDSERPLSDYVMWFDDDSYLTNTGESGSCWWDVIAGRVPDTLMLGDIWRIRQRGQQHAGIQCQPWYAGKQVSPTHKFVFCTGGWWVIRSDFVQRWNYPFPEIFHNGGDSILGELIRQQDGRMVAFKEGVVINEGRERGRRGLGLPLRTEVYPWQNHEPGQVVDLSYHNFECRVHSFQAG